MNWKKIAPWNWFEEEDTHRAHRPAVPSLNDDASEPLGAFRGEFERLFNETARQFLAGRTLPAGSSHGVTAPIRPLVDISEGRKAYTVRADLPGIEHEDVLVEAEGQTLIIRAERHQEKDEEDEGYHRIESSHGAIQRVLSLPEDADADSIHARFKNGVLKLRIPKKKMPGKPGNKIEVQPG